MCIYMAVQKWFLNGGSIGGGRYRDGTNRMAIGTSPTGNRMGSSSSARGSGGSSRTYSDDDNEDDMNAAVSMLNKMIARATGNNNIRGNSRGSNGDKKSVEMASVEYEKLANTDLDNSSEGLV
jgi:hypothetical protein